MCEKIDWKGFFFFLQVLSQSLSNFSVDKNKFILKKKNHRKHIKYSDFGPLHLEILSQEIRHKHRSVSISSTSAHTHAQIRMLQS